MAKTKKGAKKEQQESVGDNDHIIEIVPAVKPAPKKRRARKRVKPRATVKDITLDMPSRRGGDGHIIPHSHASPVGAFFLFAIGLLAGLLVFNLIINFGYEVPDNGGISYKNINLNRVAGYESDDLSFVYPSDMNVATFVTTGGEETVYLTEKAPEFTTNGIKSQPVASIEQSNETVNALVDEFTNDKTLVSAAEIGKEPAKVINCNGKASDCEAPQVIVVEHDKKVYVIRLYYPEDQTSTAGNALTTILNDFQESISFGVTE